MEETTPLLIIIGILLFLAIFPPAHAFDFELPERPERPTIEIPHFEIPQPDRAAIRSRIVRRIATAKQTICARLGEFSARISWCSGETPPNPSPELDHLVVSEVFYDVDSEHGSESKNEWIEIYNNTGDNLNLLNWSIADTQSSDTLPDIDVPNNSFLVITNDESTESFWDIPDNATVVVLGSNIGNGLGNGGDTLFLKNDTGFIIDSVSWGSSTDAFDPSAPDVIEGHSLKRIDLSIDSDTAGDWADNAIPTPGME